MDSDALKEALKNRKILSNDQKDKFVKLWKHYQDNNLQSMSDIGDEMDQAFPFLKEAIHAHIDRMPGLDFPGRPQQTLLNLIKEFGTDDFGPIFRNFTKRESIYGFGDLQVRRMLDTLTQQD